MLKNVLKKFLLMNKSGFTLSEVLLVLAIIGIIAVLGIKPLMNNVQDIQFKTAWKSSYQNVDSAAQRIISDNGSMGSVCSSGGNNCVRDLFKQYLKTTTICDAGNTEGTCWHTSGKWKQLDGSSPDSGTFKNFSGVELNNGMMVLFSYNSNKCTEVYGQETGSTSSGTLYRCGVVLIDTNGAKDPNTVGKDIFAVHLQADGLSPFGTSGDGYSCDLASSTSSDGWGCAREFLHK